MKRYDRFWSDKYWRYLLFIKSINNKYIFEDFGDETFVFSADEVAKLRKK